jgi:hypothetical protein
MYPDPKSGTPQVKTVNNEVWLMYQNKAKETANAKKAQPKAKSSGRSKNIRHLGEYSDLFYALPVKIGSTPGFTASMIDKKYMQQTAAQLKGTESAAAKRMLAMQNVVVEETVYVPPEERTFHSGPRTLPGKERLPGFDYTDDQMEEDPSKEAPALGE